MMKQFLFFLAGLILGGGIIYYLQSGSKDLKIKEAITTVDKDTKGFANIVTDSAAKQHILNFEKDPLNNTSENKFVTLSVYFDKKVFQYIGHYFDTTSRNVSGIRIYNTKYDHILLDNEIERKVPGQQDINQRSILFVPTTPDKKPDWAAWDRNTFPESKRFDGYNHGELCPNSCP